MFETMAQFVLADHIGGEVFQPPEGPMGYRRLMSRTRGPYPTADGHLALVVYTDRQWRDFTAYVGEPYLMTIDPRFATQDARTRHAEDAGAYLAHHLGGKTTDVWLEALRKLDIAACKVNSLEDLLTDPHLAAVDFFEDLEHPTEGRLRTTRFPVRFSRSPASIRRHAPRLGEHTDAFVQPDGAPEDSR